jgi:DNA-directed RNA polymerase beta subunit
MPAPEEIEMPPNVKLRDFSDFDTARTDIYDRTKKALVDSYPMSWGGVRMEVADVDYDGPENFTLEEQKKALLEERHLSRRLRGTVRLFDEKTGDMLDENKVSLMRVPYLTNRGTFIHGGNEYTTIMQSRLLPGVYTRRQNNGNLETQFNLKQSRGAFRVGFEPDTTQYRLKLGQANMHMYSLLKDLGVPDERLKKMWGDEIFSANAAKYDSRVFDKAYERLVPARMRSADASREDKVKAVRMSLDDAQVNAKVISKNLPNLFSMSKSAEWQARWAGREVMMEKIASRAHTEKFKPDLSPDECFEAFTDMCMFKCAGEEWDEIDNTGPDTNFSPDLKPSELQEQYSNLYGRVGNRLAGMSSWPKEWMPPGSNQLGWLDWYYGYADGKRTGDDDRQIKRWKSFKSRHLSQFLKNPTPRRAYALRNWAVDPLVYLDESSADVLKRQMDEYKSSKFKKAASEDDRAAQLQLLLEAKSHSDAKRYGHKHFLIQRSMTDRPTEWVIDSPGGPYPGVTHVPTGFRLHMASSKIPPTIQVDEAYALSKSPPEVPVAAKAP